MFLKHLLCGEAAGHDHHAHFADEQNDDVVLELHLLMQVCACRRLLPAQAGALGQMDWGNHLRQELHGTGKLGSVKS